MDLKLLYEIILLVVIVWFIFIGIKILKFFNKFLILFWFWILLVMLIVIFRRVCVRLLGLLVKL